MKRSMTKSGVPWADYRWNPIEGCTKISEGCQNCYAASFAHRFGRPWGTPVFHPEKLIEPMNTRKGGRVFVCSTSDFFHEKCEPIWQDRIGLEIAKHTRHTFLILTKRPQGIGAWIDRMMNDGLWPMPNLWLGVTAENQQRLDERLPYLHGTHGVRFVSVEPMIGPVSIEWSHVQPDWVICGPENGPKKRPCNPEWIDALSAESACFFDKRPDGKRKEFPQ